MIVKENFYYSPINNLSLIENLNTSKLPNSVAELLLSNIRCAIVEYEACWA